MPKFDASSVSDVEYDFTGFKGIKGSAYEGVSIEDKGTVPEPSSHQVSETMAKVNAAFKKMDLGEVEETPQGISQALDKVNDEETFAQMSGELMEALVDVCDGSPRRDSLEALGWRRFMAFFGYIMGELMSPEIRNEGSGRTQEKRLRSV